MSLNVVPGWLKILLTLAGIVLLAMLMRDNKASRGRSGQQVLLAPPQADLDNGLAGKVRNNIRQLVDNPLEKPPQAGEGTTVVRDNPENYYRDEN
jgi:hypothetical protein